MRNLLVKLMKIAYKRLKRSPYLSGIYYDVANAQYFGTFQIHEKMLADRSRVDSYYAGILKYVREGDVVIDLGSGMGILSFFASLRKPKKIYAIEHSDLIKSAEAVAIHNGIDNIEFVNMHSKKFTLDEKVDVIIQEQMGPFLFDEYMVENVIDLRDRLLKPGGRILPNKFELFVEPVKIIDNYHFPFIWEQTVYKIDFSPLSRLRESMNADHSYRFVHPAEVDYFLCDKPEPVLSFDLETLETKDLPQEIRSIRTIDRAGRLDGFCVYFNAFFDEEIVCTTSPLGPTSSWSRPLLRVESRQCQRGDRVGFRMVIPNLPDKATYAWSAELIRPTMAGPN